MSEEFLDKAVEDAKATIEEQRTQYKLADFIFDAETNEYCNLEDYKRYNKDGINSLIPRDNWEIELVPGRGGSVREIAIKPSSSIARMERGTVVEGSTWWPGMPKIIEDVVITSEGEDKAKGRRLFNTYKAPQHHQKGNVALAGLWIEHLRKLWPNDVEVLLDYFAHTVQHPEVKINFGIVLLGEQGIGKDSALLPVRLAVGSRNCKEVSPDHLFSQYNSWAASVLLIINEARPAVEDFKATHFYELLKTLCAAPPDWIMRNGKYESQLYVRNLMRVIITTNDPLSLYVPENDRRLHFAQSELQSKWAAPEYFKQLHDYYEAGGADSVYAYLLDRDISKFDPKQKPASNESWKSVVASWNTPVNDPLSEVLDELGWPDVFFGGELLNAEVAAFDNKDEVRLLLKSSRKLAGKMNAHGYLTKQAPDRQCGWQWHENGKRFKSRIAFVKKGFSGDVEAEIERRGREITSNGRAAKQKTVRLIK